MGECGTILYTEWEKSLSAKVATIEHSHSPGVPITLHLHASTVTVTVILWLG